MNNRLNKAMNNGNKIQKPTPIREIVNSSSENHQTNEKMNQFSQYFSNQESSLSSLKILKKKTSDTSQQLLQTCNFIRNNDSAFNTEFKSNSYYIQQYFLNNNNKIDDQQTQQLRPYHNEFPKRNQKQKLNKKIKEYSKIMDRVFQFLQKLFSKQNIDVKQIKFGDLEKHFIICVINKKTKMKLGIQTSFKDMIRLIQNQTQSQKRFEENFKMVLKLANDVFHKELSKIQNKVIDQDQFINHYFREISISQNINIEEFKDPSSKGRQQGINYNYNSLNNEYLKLLISSNQYSTRFQQFIKKELVNIYCQNICKKFKSMKKFLKRKLRQKFISNNYVFSSDCFKQVIEDYFCHNKQCKIPWSIQEVEYAQNQLLYRINKLI